MTAVEFDRVTLVRRGRTVVSEITAAVREGEFIGVFGPNGAGKTTLLHAILGLLRPAGGTIRVLGAPARRGNPLAGYLPQHHAPLADLRLRGWEFVTCAWDGGRWGLPLRGGAAKQQIESALDLVEARELAARPLRELSGGEIQRLLLAQALLGKPKLLLLDEPLISLDPHFQHAVVALIRRIQRGEGVTVLFTAHDLNPLLGAMDRVLYLGGGRAALGTVDEVITGEVLSSLYGTPIEVVHVGGRIAVVSGYGPVETEAHRHEHDARL